MKNSTMGRQITNKSISRLRRSSQFWLPTEGQVLMPPRSRHAGVIAALTVTGALCGCANLDLDSGGWFSRPLDLTGRKGGYTYSELQETRKVRGVTANDLVNTNGSCPPPLAATPAPTAAGAPGPLPAAAADPGSKLGEPIALGMTECEVVYRAGAPNAVQVGAKPNGDRTALLTFSSGPRPGIYRFEAGRLMEMNRVAEPPPPPPTAAKKKPAKPAKAQQKNDQA
jgi:hypothetical protein